MPQERSLADSIGEDMEAALDELGAAVQQIEDAYERIREQLARHASVATTINEFEAALSQFRPLSSPASPPAAAPDMDAARPFARMMNPPEPPPDLDAARQRMGSIRWRLRDLGQRRRRA